MPDLIKDPVIYQIIYLLSWHAFEEEREFEWHAEAIDGFLRESWEKVNPSAVFPEEKAKEYLKQKRDYILSQGKALDSFKEIRVLSTGGWVKGDGMSSELDVRSFDDTLRIHLSYMVEGEKGTDIFDKIVKNTLKTEQLENQEGGKHSYMGKALYPAAEIIGECDIDKARDISSEIFEHLLGSPVNDLKVLDYEWGYLILANDNQKMPVILYRGAEENMLSIAQLVHRILPYVFLNRCKLNYVYKLSEKSGLKLEKKEKALNDLSSRTFAGLSGSPNLETVGTLSRIEQEAVKLCETQGVFIEELTNLKGYLKEMGVISRAIDELLDRKAVSSHRTELHEYWAEDIDFVKRQLEVNLDFYVLSKESADSALDSVYKVAQIGNSQWVRIINLLMAVLASWGIVSVFGNHVPQWYLKLFIMLGLGYLLYRLLPKFQNWLRI